VVESNAPACVQALVGMRCPKLYHTSQSHPGFYTTSVGKSAAIVTLVEMLRADEIKIRSKPTVHQLLQWDGESRKRGRGEHGKHHFDRAMTVLMAAAMFRRRGYGLRPAGSRPAKPMKDGQTAVMSAVDLDAYFKQTRRKTLGIHP
jgi:hypothetical protein